MLNLSYCSEKLTSMEKLNKVDIFKEVATKVEMSKQVIFI